MADKLADPGPGHPGQVHVRTCLIPSSGEADLQEQPQPSAALAGAKANTAGAEVAAGRQRPVMEQRTGPPRLRRPTSVVVHRETHPNRSRLYTRNVETVDEVRQFELLQPCAW